MNKKMVLALSGIVLFLCLAAIRATGPHGGKKYAYCLLLLGTGRNTKVDVDYGDGKGFVKLLRADGKPMAFPTEIDALNYMGAQGWEMVSPTVEWEVVGFTRVLMKREE